LFGVLALLVDFVDRDALVRAMTAWLLDKSKPLGQILVEQGVLPAADHAQLEALVDRHIQRHEADPRKSLATVAAPRPVVEQLRDVSDPDLHASLMCLPETQQLTGPDATKATCDPPANGKASSAAGTRDQGGRFRILRAHAHGGLGEVFVAQDEEVGREVALKQIQGRYAHDPEKRGRFLLEAEITGRLEHPGVVPIYGLGSYTDGRPFYAMRLIRGHSLKEAIRRFHETNDPTDRRLGLRQLLGRFVSVCNTIAYAHSRGVLHRDVKPSNIMVGQYGETLVVDWGVAKAGGCSEQSNSVRDNPIQAGGGSAVTQIGSVLGTPQFMSPEQAAGAFDRLGPASDVYSLGATLYCILTGRTPFAGDNLASVLAKVQAGEFLTPTQVKPGVPAALDATCVKAMALRPEDRYPSALALADAVERWLADEPVSGLTDQVFTISADGRYTSLVPAFESRYGWSRDEWLGKHFAGMVHPDDLALCVLLFQRCLAGETPPVFRTRLLTKSGRYVTDEITGILQVLEGKVVGVMGMSRAVEPAESE
jgi:serine/threonine-protein kinase